MALEQLFRGTQDWEDQQGGFYQCAMSDVTVAVPERFQRDIIARMREVTGLPLTERVLITVQRMLPGQMIGVHSDRPLLGYEMARLVVQFNKAWQAEDGGVLELFSSTDGAAEGAAIKRINPEYNSAFGFLLQANSHHAVSAVSKPRQTMVFNFWHVANSRELATHVRELFAHLDFSEFPRELNALASATEASVPEEVSYRAGVAASALQRWGYEAHTVVTGYQYSAGLCNADDEDAETTAAVLLADWVAYLYCESFDLSRWQVLLGKLDGLVMFARLAPTWRLCLP